MNKRGFASDNNAGVHPKVMEAIYKANDGHVIAYGDDPYTRRAIETFKDTFGNDIQVYFVFLGTGANVLGLKAATESFQSIICAASAHIMEDECGAPERFTGCKLIPVETTNGKLTVRDVDKHVYNIDFEHHSQPRVISVTQATELGTVYTVPELRALTGYAHEKGMVVHMDGARIANAAVSLGVTLREVTRDAGIDVLSFGGTKNGLMYGEAIVFFNTDLAKNFKYVRKQGMQLASKMRFISVQFDCLLRNDLWKRNAGHANKMARLLEKEVSSIPGVRITQPVESNGVFAILPPGIIPLLQKEYFFYKWNETTNEVRWMTSWDTKEEDVYAFAGLIRSLLSTRQN